MAPLPAVTVAVRVTALPEVVMPGEAIRIVVVDSEATAQLRAAGVVLLSAFAEPL